MKNIGIVVNQKKKGALELLEALKSWLLERDAVVRDSTSTPTAELVSLSDMLVCLGGDGTLLSLVSRLSDDRVPVMGVNLGSLGFLTEVKQDEIFEELQSCLSGKAGMEPRFVLRCTARSRNTPDQQACFAGLNDIVVSREGLTRLLAVEITVSGDKLTAFRGDGVIIATPTGSTAYSLSAGGPIVHPRLETLIITPICPHASALRPMVVGACEKISIRIGTDREGEKALLTADGQENLEIDDSYTVEITRSNHMIKLIKSSRRNYFETLRENFKFPQ